MTEERSGLFLEGFCSACTRLFDWRRPIDGTLSESRHHPSQKKIFCSVSNVPSHVLTFRLKSNGQNFSRFFFSHFLIHSCVCLSLSVQYSSWARIRLQDILRLKEREIRRKKKDSCHSCIHSTGVSKTVICVIHFCFSFLTCMSYVLKSLCSF